MPQWIYSRPPEKCQENELRFAGFLNDRLGDDWFVRWGYWYHDNDGTLREGDFLVLGPFGGLAVFEVKSSVGFLALTGQWGTDDGDSPVTQLMAQFSGVLNHLKQIARGRHCPWVAKALVFPALEVATNISAHRGIPRELIVAANDLLDFGAAWRRLFKKCQTLTADERDVFLEAYGEDIQPSAVRAFVTETDKLFLRQSTANYRILDMLSGNRQLVVEGGVGSGKSWHAIEQARRFAENTGGSSGRVVLMVAYNIALCERLRTTVSRLRLTRGHITVRSAESLAAAILEACGLPHEVPTNPDEIQRYFNEVLPGLALDALSMERETLETALHRYDALVVDEVQDHDTSLPCASGESDEGGLWGIYAALLKDGWQSPIAVFGDPGQRPPFRRPGGFNLSTLRSKLSQHAHLRLRQAVRYTLPVYQFLKQLDGDGTRELVAGLQTDGQLPGGSAVILKEAPADQIPQAVEQILTSWETSGLCVPSKVLILYDRSTMDRTALGGIESLCGHHLAPFLDLVDEPNHRNIGHTSIHKAKGLDALAVILVGLRPFDQLTTPYDRFTYFMGASRARQLLACVHVTLPPDGSG